MVEQIVITSDHISSTVPEFPGMISSQLQEAYAIVQGLARKETDKDRVFSQTGRLLHTIAHYHGSHEQIREALTGIVREYVNAQRGRAIACSMVGDVEGTIMFLNNMKIEAGLRNGITVSHKAGDEEIRSLVTTAARNATLEYLVEKRATAERDGNAPVQEMYRNWIMERIGSGSFGYQAPEVTFGFD